MPGHITRAWADGPCLYLRTEWPDAAAIQYRDIAIDTQGILAARCPATMLADAITDALSDRHTQDAAHVD